MKSRRRNSTGCEPRASSASTSRSRPAAISEPRMIVSRWWLVRSLARRCDMAGEPQLYESGNSVKRARLQAPAGRRSEWETPCPQLSSAGMGVKAGAEIFNDARATENLNPLFDEERLTANRSA